MQTKFQEHDEKNVFAKGVKCVRHTNKAILIEIEGEGGKKSEHWIPQSMVHADSDVYKAGDCGKLVISKWIAKERGWWDDD